MREDKVVHGEYHGSKYLCKKLRNYLHRFFDAFDLGHKATECYLDVNDKATEIQSQFYQSKEAHKAIPKFKKLVKLLNVRRQGSIMEVPWLQLFM